MDVQIYLWNVFERDFTQCARCTIAAPTKIDAEIQAFNQFKRPMDVDVVRSKGESNVSVVESV